MNVIEIVSRPSPQIVSQDEMEYVVEQYIKERKGADVKIDIEKGINRNSILARGLLLRQLKMLEQAFDEASSYFIQKNI